MKHVTDKFEKKFDHSVLRFMINYFKAYDDLSIEEKHVFDQELENELRSLNCADS